MGSIPYRYSTTPTGPFVIPTFNNGVDGVAKMVTMASVLDGTSNTAAFQRAADGDRQRHARLSTTQVVDPTRPTSNMYNLTPSPGGVIMNSYPSAAAGGVYQTCQNLNPLTAGIAGVGVNGGAYYQELNGDTTYNHVMPPNGNSCVVGILTLNGGTTNSDNHHPQGALTANSRHSGGVNVGMLDGSVRFVKSTVSPQTWWAVGTIASNEVIDASSW